MDKTSKPRAELGLTGELRNERSKAGPRTDSKRHNTNPKTPGRHPENAKKQHRVLTDITDNANFLKVASGVLIGPETGQALAVSSGGRLVVPSPLTESGLILPEKMKRSLSTKTTRHHERPPSGTATPLRVTRNQPRRCQGSYHKNRLKTMRSQQCGYFVSPSRFMGTSRKLDINQSSFFKSPVQYTLLTERSQKTLKLYFKKRKELEKKYADMLNELKEEEIGATKCAVMQSKAGKLNIDIETALDEIKNDYRITENLLLQQRLVEEEELHRSYPL